MVYLYYHHNDNENSIYVRITKTNLMAINDNKN